MRTPDSIDFTKHSDYNWSAMYKGKKFRLVAANNQWLATFYDNEHPASVLDPNKAVAVRELYRIATL